MNLSSQKMCNVKRNRFPIKKCDDKLNYDAFVETNDLIFF